MKSKESVSPRARWASLFGGGDARYFARAVLGTLSVSCLLACTADSEPAADNAGEALPSTRDAGGASGQHAPAHADAGTDAGRADVGDGSPSASDTQTSMPSNGDDASSVTEPTDANSSANTRDAAVSLTDHTAGADGTGEDAQAGGALTADGSATLDGGTTVGSPATDASGKAVCDPSASYGHPLDDAAPAAGIEFERLFVDAGIPGFGGSPGGLAGMQIADGQVWIESRGVFLFSRIDLPHQIWQLAPDSLEPSLFMDSGGGKGMTLDKQQRLVIADPTQRITRIDPSAASPSVEVLFDMDSIPFVPNDLIVRDDGSIYVTDNQSGAYHISPSGVVSAILGAGTDANGVALSLDQQQLYVSATTEQTVTQFTLGADGSVDAASAKLLFSTQTGNANGMTLDCAGNFYVATNGGVEVFTKDGEPVTLIAVPERAVNVAFGGEDQRTLFIASQASVYLQRLGVPGLPN